MNVAGNRNGWSAAMASRSSPVSEKKIWVWVYEQSQQLTNLFFLCLCFLPLMLREEEGGGLKKSGDQAIKTCCFSPFPWKPTPRIGQSKEGKGIEQAITKKCDS